MKTKKLGWTELNLSVIGLGLSISEQTINRHSGEISVESQPGNGATFIIKLPITVNNGGS